jgi:DNA-binding XRE family transcriptional regulator
LTRQIVIAIEQSRHCARLGTAFRIAHVFKSQLGEVFHDPGAEGETS